MGGSNRLTKAVQITRSPRLVIHMGKVGVAGKRYPVAIEEVSDDETVCKPGDIT